MKTAVEWLDKFYLNVASLEDRKQCALIAVNEILNTLYSLKFGNAIDIELEYFEELKQEIEKI